MNRQKLACIGLVLSIFASLGPAVFAQEPDEQPIPRSAAARTRWALPSPAAEPNQARGAAPETYASFSASPDQTAIPLGSYSANVEKTTNILDRPYYFSGEYQLTFAEGGKVRFGRNDFGVFVGAYAVTGNRITFSPSSGLGGCVNAGTYQFAVQGNRLSLSPIATLTDGCASRVVALTAAPFIKNDPAASGWRQLGPEGGRVYALLVNDGKVYAGTDGGGVFVSSDNGQNWKATRGIRGFQVFSLAAFNGNLFAGTTGGQIFISTDGGQNWEFYGGGIPTNITTYDFAVSGGRLYAATLGDGVWRMGDNPYTWERAGTTGLTNLLVYTLAVSGANLFAGTAGGGIHVSTDGGATWRTANTGITVPRIRSIAVDGGKLYASTISTSVTTVPNEVYVSENLGQSWTRLGNGIGADFPPNFTNLIYKLTPMGGRLFGAGTSGVLMFDGARWSTVHTGSPIVSFFAVAASGNTLFAGAWYDGVSRSTDGGVTWAKTNSGLQGRATWTVLKERGVLYLGTSDGGFISRDEGLTWIRSNPAINVTTFHYLVFDNKVYAGASNGMYVTADQGQTWTRVSTGLGAGVIFRFAALGNALYAAVYNGTTGGVYRSADGGLSWTAALNGLTSRLVEDLVIIGNNIFVCTDNAGVFRSSDEGQNWTAVNNGLPAGVILAMAASGNTLLANVLGQAIYRTSDNGQTWTKSQDGVDIPVFQWMYSSSGNVYASPDGGYGVLRSTDEGRSWQTVLPPLEARFANNYFVSGGTLYVTSPNGLFVNNGLVNRAATVSAASFSANAIAEKAIVAAFGTGLATGSASASSQPLPTTLAGTGVRVTDSNGVARIAPLFFVAGGQVNYQIPAGTAAGAASVAITNSDGISATGEIIVRASAPAVFTANASGSGAAIAVDAITFAPGPFNATQANGQPNIIAVFGTGLGGDATDVDGDVKASTTARLNGNIVTLLYAGRVPGLAGLNQFNVVLPANITAGTYTLTMTRGGFTSNSVTLAIR